jgi:hypothetical protein
MTTPPITFGELTDEALDLIADLLLDELEAEAADRANTEPQEPAA